MERVMEGDKFQTFYSGGIFAATTFRLVGVYKSN